VFLRVGFRPSGAIINPFTGVLPVDGYDVGKIMFIVIPNGNIQGGRVIDIAEKEAFWVRKGILIAFNHVTLEDNPPYVIEINAALLSTDERMVAQSKLVPLGRIPNPINVKTPPHDKSLQYLQLSIDRRCCQPSHRTGQRIPLNKAV
jgi:hypothetical protein